MYSCLPAWLAWLDGDALGAWLLLLPIAFVVVQITWPTLLGWAVIFYPSVALLLVFEFSVVTLFARPGATEREAACVGVLGLGAMAIVCGALISARPESKDVPSAP